MGTTVRILSLSIALGALSGCGSFPPTLVDEKIVSLDIKKSRPVWISSATAYRDDNQMVVRGEARHPNSSHFGQFSGHIDIDIVLPTGENIAKHNVRLVRKRIPKRSSRRASFVSRFDTDPPKGTIVRMAYHIGEH